MTMMPTVAVPLLRIVPSMQVTVLPEVVHDPWVVVGALVGVIPAGRVAVRTTPLAVAAPRLSRLSVVMSCWPCVTGFGATVCVRRRSAVVGGPAGHPLRPQTDRLTVAVLFPL